MNEIKPVELPDIEFCVADGIFIKQMFLADAGIFVPQHSHKYAHTSMLASGKIRVWQDDVKMGDFSAPMPIYIAEGVKHTFVSLEPNTVVYCIHRMDRTGEVEIEQNADAVDDEIVDHYFKSMTEV